MWTVAIVTKLRKACLALFKYTFVEDQALAVFNG